MLLAGFLWVSVDVVRSGPLVSFDHTLDDWVRIHAPEAAVVFARHTVNLVGQRLYDVPPMAVLAIVLARRRRTWRPVLVTLTVMVLLAIVVPGMKIWTGRTNPRSGHDLLWVGGSEYPSGHEINAIVIWGMTFALAACLDSPVGRWLTPARQAWLTGLTATVVAADVLLLRTHWFSDVLASVLFAPPLLWSVKWFGFLGQDPPDAAEMAPPAEPETEAA